MEQRGQQPNSEAVEAGALPAASEFVPYNPYAAPGNPPAADGNGASPPAPAYRYATTVKPQVSYGAAASDFRPLNISEMLDRSFALYRRNFSAFLTILGVAYVPYLVLDVIFKVWWLRSVTSDIARFQSISPFSSYDYNDTISSLGHFYASLGVYIILLAGINVLMQVATAALIYAANERYHGRTITTGAAYRYVGGRISALLGWVALVYLLFIIAGIGFVFLIGIIAVPIIAPFFFISLPALIVERAGPGQALQRSRELVGKGYWGMSMGLWLATVLLIWLLTQGVGTVLTLLLSQLPGLNPTTVLALDLAFSGLLDFVLAPISIIAFTIFYLNLRVRIEAYDIEALAAATMAR
ncbi:MAG: hypothetical protein DLM69_04945 [Candidatus Chloroheliales bacterium]|nr:MAG: hypothetical protein DLM69_04945 [Chloroflexota bacterium]